MVAGFAITPHRFDRRHYQFAQGRHQLLYVGAEEHVFLWRFAHYGRREYCVFAVVKMAGLQYGVVVLQRVVAVVVAEGAFGLAHVRRHDALDGELGFGD